MCNAPEPIFINKLMTLIMMYEGSALLSSLLAEAASVIFRTELIRCLSEERQISRIH